MNMRSREVALGLAIVGLLSYAACTAEKTEMKTTEIAAVPVNPSPTSMKLVDGVFASHEELKAVYFDLNQSKLSEKEMDVVKENAEWLKTQPPFLIKVVGFTDNRGSMKKNQRLGMLRAKTVSDSYITLGIPKERIMISGRIEEDPTCQPLTDECLTQIRRSETLIEDKSLAKR